jgi:hypothetical protein
LFGCEQRAEVPDPLVAPTDAAVRAMIFPARIHPLLRLPRARAWAVAEFFYSPIDKCVGEAVFVLWCFVDAYLNLTRSSSWLLGSNPCQ